MTALETIPGQGCKLQALSVFLFSTAMLGIQIVWTRIFSFMIWYHFAFLVISISMLGFTVGGLLLNLRPRLLEKSASVVLFWSAVGFCLFTTVSLVITCNLPFDGGVLDSARNFGLFVLLMLLVGGEFLFAGLFISFAIAAHPGRVFGVYFANMIGSGVGCSLSVVLLDRMLPASALLLFTLLGWTSTLSLFPLLADKRRPVLAAAGTFTLATLGFLVSLDPLAEPFFMKSAKPFPAVAKRDLVARRSNSLSTVDFFRPGRLSGLWGYSEAEYFADHPGLRLPDRLGFCIDGWALTFAYRADGDPTTAPVFDYLPSTLAYDVSKPVDVLVIGAGGGIDVICALRRGAKEITAVEINPIILDVGVNELAQFNGGIFLRPGVTPVLAEGRSFITGAGDRTWDLIQLSGVDTLAASQAGAFTLAENYLYTREAFEGYFRRLKPGGILTMTRWMFRPERQTLRVITIADAALRRLGVADTSKNMILIADASRNYSVFLLSATPFSREQAQQVLDTCAAKGFLPLAVPYFPREPSNAYETLIHLPDKTDFIRDYPFDISVTTDDKPFFFEHSKWLNAWKYPDYIFNKYNGQLVLILTTVLVVLLAAIFITIPARYGLKRAEPGGPRRAVLVFFAALGLGYVLVEMVLVQKLTLYLGNPAYALAVVLSAMLGFSGVGSLVSGKLPGAAPKRLVACCLAVAATLVLYRFALDPLLTGTLAAPVGTRVAFALAALALPATLMGMPFPTAVSALQSQKDLVVRGWVVNGYCSVLAACLAMILAITFGFHAVLLTGAAVYALAAAARPLGRYSAAD